MLEQRIFNVNIQTNFICNDVNLNRSDRARSKFNYGLIERDGVDLKKNEACKRLNVISQSDSK